MFPQARYIYMVRDPYSVFPSTVHFWKTMYSIHGLQRPNLEALHDYVFDTFLAMHGKFEATRELIQREQFCLLRYEELARDPLTQMRALYEHFRWQDFDTVEPAIRQYAERSKRYKTNRYELTPGLRDEITRRWSPYIEKYGYGSES